MSRRAGRSRRRGRARRRHHHPLFVLFAVVVAISFATTGALALAGLLAIVMSTAEVLLIVFVVAQLLRMRRRAALRRAARARPRADGLPGPRESTERRWREAQRRMARLRTEYAGFECDPLAVLRLPALADVRVGATARFVDAFAEAQALDTDRLPAPEYAARYADAVDRACRAWRAARESAERIRLSGLSTDERARVDKVIKLLTMARDTPHDAERATAYARARDELARLDLAGAISLPPAALATLEVNARGILTT